MNSKTIYVFFGLIASGKSTLATLFAAGRGLACYNTDRVRKELAGLAANERRPDELGQGIYTAEFTAKTYQAMLDRAGQDLQEGAQGVVLDGSYGRRADRNDVIQLSDEQKANALFILCTCSDTEVKRRLALRAEDPMAVSDGRWDIFIRQKESFEFPDELRPEQLLQLDTEAEPEQLLSRLESVLKNRP
jgi:predicted kinase